MQETRNAHPQALPRNWAVWLAISLLVVETLAIGRQRLHVWGIQETANRLLYICIDSGLFGINQVLF